MFSSDTEGRDCGNEVAKWLTRYLAADKVVRLVHFEPQLKARTPPEKGFPKDEKVWFSKVFFGDGKILVMDTDMCLLL